MIDKEAQQLSWWNKFKEKANIPRQLSEKMHEAYSSQMEILRSVDDDIRELLAESPIKDIVKEIKQDLKDRKYLDYAHHIGTLNTLINKISKKKGELINDREEHVTDFYGDFEDFDLEGADKYFTTSAGYNAFLLEKQAGVFDYFSDRQRGARYLEKVYKNTVKKRHDVLTKFLDITETFAEDSIDLLKDLASYRTSGNISDYIATLNKLGSIQSKFNEKFKKVYDENIAVIAEAVRERVKQRDAALRAAEEKAIAREKEVEEQEDGYAPPLRKSIFDTPAGPLKPSGDTVISSPSIPKANNDTLISGQDPEGWEESPPSSWNPGSESVDLTELNQEINPPSTVRSDSGPMSDIELSLDDLKDGPNSNDNASLSKIKKELYASQVYYGSYSDSEFVRELNKVSNPGLQSAMLCKYSEVLEDRGEVEASIKLLRLAQDLLK